MRRLIIALSVVLALSSNGRAAAPTVTSVSAAQRTDDSGIVDIFYTLGHADGLACTVGVLVSPDGGSSWMVPPPALSGDVGPSISPGERHIEWPSKVVLPGAYGTQYRVRVIADDGVADPWSGPPPGMVFVSIADRDFAGQMSRYETTNAQYCHFLNAALASGDITVSGNDAMGASGSNSGADYAGELYYNGDGAGTTYNGATNGGAARIFYSAGAFHVDVGFGNHPVTYVTWYGAMAFADYYGYYLPTESNGRASRTIPALISMVAARALTIVRPIITGLLIRMAQPPLAVLASMATV